MRKIYCIVTHHDCKNHSKEDAADEWIAERVCAIGYNDINLESVITKEQVKNKVITNWFRLNPKRYKAFSRRRKLQITADVNSIWNFFMYKKRRYCFGVLR